MKAYVPAYQFSAARTLGLAALLALAGCGTATIDDAVPRPGVRNEYPNLNVAPQPATQQISNEERDEATGLLRARRASSQAASVGPAPNGAELRRLGQRHGEDVLRAIENE